MIFSDKQLDSFIALYQKKFAVKLDRGEAEKQAFALVSLIDRLYKPMTAKEHKKYYGKKH